MPTLIKKYYLKSLRALDAYGDGKGMEQKRFINLMEEFRLGSAGETNDTVADAGEQVWLTHFTTLPLDYNS